MKKTQQKKLTPRQSLLAAAAALIVMVALFFIIRRVAAKEPQWDYVQSFRNDNILTTVQQTSIQRKNSYRQFFLVQGFDFRSNKSIPAVEVNIDQKMGGDVSYIGFTANHIWLETPQIAAVDMRSDTPHVLDFEELSRLIVSKNRTLVKSVIEIFRLESHLAVTNEQGDRFFLNAVTFELVKKLPGSEYDYYPDFHLTTTYPETTQYVDNYVQDKFISTDGKHYYSLVQVSPSNKLKFHLVSEMVPGPGTSDIRTAEPIEFNVGDVQPSTLIQQTPVSEDEFLLAKSIGLKNNLFVFTCKKTNEAAAPTFLVWYDVVAKKIVKEIDLQKEGFGKGYVRIFCARDEQYLFVTEAGKQPKRFKLTP